MVKYQLMSMKKIQLKSMLIIVMLNFVNINIKKTKILIFFLFKISIIVVQFSNITNVD